MANRLSKEKANLIASNYMTNGLKKVQALLEAGYSVNYSNNTGLKLFDNERVKQAISRIEAAKAAETGRTVQSIDQMQQSAYDLAMQNNQPSAAVSAAQAIARLYGMDKQTTVSERTPDQPEGKEAEVLTGLNKQYKVKLSGTG